MAQMKSRRAKRRIGSNQLQGAGDCANALTTVNRKKAP